MEHHHQSTGDDGRRHSGGFRRGRVAIAAIAIEGVVLVLLFSSMVFFHLLQSRYESIRFDHRTALKEISLSYEPLAEKLAVLNFVRDRARGIDETRHVEIVEAILDQERKYQFSAATILAIIQVESSFRNYAVSPMGAMGLMQIEPLTGEALCRELGIPWRGPHTLFDPVVNIECGSYYLSCLLSRFETFGLALEAYNKGPTRVSEQLATGIRVLGVYSRRVDRVSGEFFNSLGIVSSGEGNV